MNAQKCSNLALHLTCTFLAALFGLPSMLNAQTPSLVDPNLRVRTVVENLDQPTSMAFIASNDLLVLEKATGKVQRVVNGVLTSTVLDLAVNSFSERGLWALRFTQASLPTRVSIFTGPKAPLVLTHPNPRTCRSWAIGSISSSGTAPPSLRTRI